MDKPGFESLPVEMLEGVCGFTQGTRVLKDLRLVSRQLCVKTQNVFAKRQFTNINVCLSRKDLEGLNSILSHAVFGKLVKSLRIRPSFLGPWVEDRLFFITRSIANVAQFANVSEAQARSVHDSVTAAQLSWRHGEDEVALLVSAFRLVSRLDRLDIGFEDPDTAKKATNPLTGQLMNTRHKVSGRYEEDSHEDGYNSTSHGVQVVLAALGRTKLDLGELHAGSGHYTIQTNVLRFPQLRTSELRGCLQNITTLSLGIDALCGAADEEWPESSDESLAEFLSETVALHSLNLYFERDLDFEGYRNHSANKVESIFDMVCNHTHLPKLRSLKLDHACVLAEDLIGFLTRHKDHIESLELSCLVAVDEPPFHQNIRLVPAIGELLVKCPRLKTLSLSQISSVMGCVLFGPPHLSCVYCAYPRIAAEACDRSELKVTGDEIHSPITAELLARSQIRFWSDWY